MVRTCPFLIACKTKQTHHHPNTATWYGYVACSKRWKYRRKPGLCPRYYAQFRPVHQSHCAYRWAGNIDNSAGWHLTQASNRTLLRTSLREKWKLFVPGWCFCWFLMFVPYQPSAYLMVSTPQISENCPLNFAFCVPNTQNNFLKDLLLMQNPALPFRSFSIHQPWQTWLLAFHCLS